MIVDDLEETPHKLIITGAYKLMNDERAIKAMIRRWVADTGAHDYPEETLIQKMIRRWKGEPLKRRGEIRCVVELDKDQMIYTAHFH